MIRRYVVMPMPYGSIGLVATRRGLSNVMLTKQGLEKAEQLLHSRFPEADYDADLFPELQSRLSDYFVGRRVRFQVNLDLSSLTVFQRKVLQACTEIDYGKTETYSQLARRIGQPTAARAVGGALARNPMPIVIPCHRVVAADGSLGGFSAEQGVILKRRLLELENNNTR